MIRIAVCDDEVIFVRCLRDMVEALFEKQGMEFQCFVYTSAPELIRAHRKEEFQLLFLDIDMPEMSGMELAAENQSHEFCGSFDFRFQSQRLCL